MAEAHPLHDTKYLNFDAATGEPVKLAFDSQGWSMPAPAKIAEKYFRNEKERAARLRAMS